jgi:serine protease
MLMIPLAKTLFVVIFSAVLAAPGVAQTPPATGRMVELYNTILNHYFYTNRTNGELEVIERGGAGPGWVRTGIEFETALSQYTQTLTFFRFYGSPTIGPNSHFCTTDPAEADTLRALQAATPDGQQRWNYEGILHAPVFRFLPDSDPRREFTFEKRGCVIGGATPPMASRIFRFYNNGAQRGIDSNHRFVYERDDGTMEKMTSEGWTREGIVFCSLRVFRNNVAFR